MSPGTYSPLENQEEHIPKNVPALCWRQLWHAAPLTLHKTNAFTGCIVSPTTASELPQFHARILPPFLFFFCHLQNKHFRGQRNVLSSSSPACKIQLSNLILAFRPPLPNSAGNLLNLCLVRKRTRPRTKHLVPFWSELWCRIYICYINYWIIVSVISVNKFKLRMWLNQLIAKLQYVLSLWKDPCCKGNFQPSCFYVSKMVSVVIHSLHSLRKLGWELSVSSRQGCFLLRAGTWWH